MIEHVWTRSTKCESSACVEAATNGDFVGIRNSRVPGEVIWADPGEWQAFIDGVKAGEFDL